jgi:(p)ppGpp synthase/HD superfamily hydrolase
MLEKAIEIALKAHKGQRDKAGEPYIGHLLRVMHAGKTEDEKICGVLHDLIEDTDWTFDELRKQGFEEHITDALQCLTKQRGESYDQFLERVLSNRLAVKVKINDLTDNMDIKRLKTLTDRDLERLNKYLKAYRRLINYL